MDSELEIKIHPLDFSGSLFKRRSGGDVGCARTLKGFCVGGKRRSGGG